MVLQPNAAGLMWQRLFHRDWRSRTKLNIPVIAAGNKIRRISKVFHGEYQVVVAVGGVKVHEERVSVKKNNQRPTSLNITITA